MSNTFEDAPVISSYTWEQGVEDGALAKVFENRWPQLSNGKNLCCFRSWICCSGWRAGALLPDWKSRPALDLSRSSSTAKPLNCPPTSRMGNVSSHSLTA